jgi:hypothetical protein
VLHLNGIWIERFHRSIMANTLKGACTFVFDTVVAGIRPANIGQNAHEGVRLFCRMNMPIRGAGIRLAGSAPPQFTDSIFDVHVMGTVRTRIVAVCTRQDSMTKAFVQV